MKYVCKLLIAIATTAAAVIATPVFYAQSQAHAASGENAIARLNYAGLRKKGHCTAVLIGKSRVLTARHCVDKWPRTDLRLVFGYAKGDWVEVRKVKSIAVHKRQDIAVLCLNKPSAQKAIAVAQNLSTSRVQSATIIGYPRSRAHLPNTQICALQAGKTRTRFECPIEPGMSGSPVMQIINDTRTVVGIASQTSAAFSIIERLRDLPKVDC